MSEMIERVAKGIIGALNATDGGGTAWDDASDEMRQSMFPLARAAIEAMREPTKSVLLAGLGACLDEHALEVWQAMIDEALKG